MPIKTPLDGTEIPKNERDDLALQLGLPLLATMTDREVAEETLHHLRSVGAALQQFQKVGPAGLMKMMLTGGK